MDNHIVWISTDSRVTLTFSALRTKINTAGNSIDPNETVLNEPSHQEKYCLPFLFVFWLTLLITTMDNVSSFKDSWAHIRRWWWFRVLRPFQHYLSYIETREGDNERLYAIKLRTVMSWIPPLAELEPRTSWSVVGNANHSAIEPTPEIRVWKWYPCGVFERVRNAKIPFILSIYKAHYLLSDGTFYMVLCLYLRTTKTMIRLPWRRMLNFHGLFNPSLELEGINVAYRLLKYIRSLCVFLQ